VATNKVRMRKKSNVDSPPESAGKSWLEEDNRIRVLKLFFAGPGKQLYIREVARQTGLSPRGAQMILESLRKEGLLISESNNVVNNYRGNFDDRRFVGLKRSLNLYSIYSCGLIQCLEKYYHMPECIILFGSYAKGEEMPEVSDIDIAVVTEMTNLPDMHNFQSTLGKSISLHLIENIKDQNANFVNSLANGIVLSGYMEAV
jgi:predicted nucleotidyltransferase